MLSPAIRVEPNTPDFDFCIALCTSTQDATYATWSHLDHNCMYKKSFYFENITTLYVQEPHLFQGAV